MTNTQDIMFIRKIDFLYALDFTSKRKRTISEALITTIAHSGLLSYTSNFVASTKWTNTQNGIKRKATIERAKFIKRITKLK